MAHFSDNFPDPHFGTEEQMLAWCEREGLTPVKGKRGEWDWPAVWDEYCKRLDADPTDDSTGP